MDVEGGRESQEMQGDLEGRDAEARPTGRRPFYPSVSIKACFPQFPEKPSHRYKRVPGLPLCALWELVATSGQSLLLMCME